MPNFTLDDYKEEIRIKYEKEKEGVYSNYLSNPSQANLRDLCWEIFQSNTKISDLKVYFDFSKFEFDCKNENTSTAYTDKFKKVGDFLKREKEPAKIVTVDLAAILVDFQPRPYTKYRKIGLCKEEVDNPNVSYPLSLQQRSDNDKNGEADEADNIKKYSLVNNTENNKHSKRFKNKVRGMLLTIVIFLFLVTMVIYFAFFKKECMRWTGDYYEKEYCIHDSNNLDIVPYEEIQFRIKKIIVSDTTTFFKLGKPCVWYSRSYEGNYECFTAPGLHPETGKTLKPITQYIIDKHLFKKEE